MTRDTQTEKLFGRLKEMAQEHEEFRTAIMQAKEGVFEFDPRWLMHTEDGVWLAEQLDDHPEDFIKALETAAATSDNFPWTAEKARAVIYVPDTWGATKRIQELGSKDEEKLVVIEGTVKSKTEKFTQVTMIKWECNLCGEIIPQTIFTEMLPKKRKCKCGGWATRILSKEYDDRFYITIEESYENSKNNELKKMPVVFGRGLSKPWYEERITRGTPVRIAGRLVMKEKKPNSALFDFWFMAYGINIIAEEGKNITVTREATEKLHEIKERMSIVRYWSENLFTVIQGEQGIKESLIVQMVGNEPVKKGNKKTRGDIHIMMIGDAGSAKSTFLKLVQGYAIKTRYAAGKGASGVGITASTQKDELLGTWVVEAGAFPLAHHGILCLDEVDKLDKGETDRLHEAMEQQELTVDRANIHVTLPCQTSLLAAGNPERGSFDNNQDLYSQINFPPTFLNRFDLIWVMEDKTDTERDQKIAETVLRNLSTEPDKEDIKLFKQYLTIAKLIKVETPPEMHEELVKWYQEMRINLKKDGNKSRFNARSLESVARLMMAHARAELKEKVDKSDLKWAVKTYIDSLRYIAIDPLTGEMDIERVQTGVSYAEMKLHNAIPEALKRANGKKMTYEELRLLFDKVPEYEFEKTLAKLSKHGEIYESPMGTWRII